MELESMRLKNQRAHWNSSFIDSSSNGKLYFFVLLYLLREVQEGCSGLFCFFQWNSSSTGKFFFLVLLCLLREVQEGCSVFLCFFKQNSSFIDSSSMEIFFFLFCSVFLCSFQESFTGEFFFSFFLVMQTNQKLKRVHALVEKQRQTNCEYNP